MGQTIHELSRRELKPNKIFNHRFVIELCEGMHFHYRNFRFMLNRDSWHQIAKGCSDSLARWMKRGFPAYGTKHMELCRKQVVPEEKEMMCINLNKNLYNRFEDKVFSEGNDFKEPEYIHVKYRDLRIEMPIQEFNDFAAMVRDAQTTLVNLKYYEGIK